MTELDFNGRGRLGPPILAVGLDVFGTLIDNPVNLNPYKRLLGHGAPSFGPERAAFRHKVMTTNLSPEELARQMGYEAQAPLMRAELGREIAPMALFPEAAQVLAALRENGLRIGLCSNLAQAYGDIVRTFLAEFVDVTILSYEVGLAKPDPRIFAKLSDELGVERCRILFVGDSMVSDVEGAAGAGLIARHLRRSVGQTLFDVLGATLGVDLRAKGG